MWKMFKSWPEWVLISLLLVLALIVRLPLLNGSFWLDEAAQALESIRPLSQQFDIMADFQPPLLHLIVHFASYLGVSEWWLRTWGALIPGLFTIFFTYKIGHKLFSKQVGAWAGILLSTSFLHVFYSQELRPYALPAMWSAWGWLVIINAWQSKKTNWKNVFLFAFISTLGLYSSYLYPFLLLTQLVLIGWLFRKYWQKWIWGIIIPGLLFLPWLPSFLKQLQVGSVLRSSLPGWDQVVSIPQLKVLPLTAATFVFGELDFEFNFGYLLVSMLLLMSVGWIAYMLWQKKLFSKKLVVLVAWLVVPSLLAWIVSFWIPVLQPKRVLFSLPALYLLIAASTTLVVDHVKPKWQQYLGWSLIYFVICINLFALYSYWSNPLLQRENWRQLVFDVTTAFPSYSATLFAFPEAFAPWIWYAPADYPQHSTGVIMVTSDTDLDEMLKPINQYQYIIVFDYLRDLTDPNSELERYLESHDFQARQLLDYPRIGFVRIYSRPEAVISYTQSSL